MKFIKYFLAVILYINSHVYKCCLQSIICVHVTIKSSVHLAHDRDGVCFARLHLQMNLSHPLLSLSLSYT